MLAATASAALAKKSPPPPTNDSGLAPPVATRVGRVILANPSVGGRLSPTQAASYRRVWAMASSPGHIGELRAPATISSEAPASRMNRSAASPLGQEPLEACHVLPVPPPPALGHVVGHLVHRQPVDPDPGRRGLQHEPTTRGDAVQVRRPAGLGDQRLQVLDLTLHRIRPGVATVTAPPPVVVVHAEPLRQLRRQRRVLRPVDKRPTHQDHRRPSPEPLVGDRRAVLGRHLVHAPPPRNRHNAGRPTPATTRRAGHRPWRGYSARPRSGSRPIAALALGSGDL